MSSDKKGIAGRLEWLVNVQTAIKGLIGTFALLVAGEGIALYSNPTHTMQLFNLLEVNTHFWSSLQLGVPLVVLIVIFYFSRPVEIGLQESEAKMWFLSLKKEYTHLKSILNQEEGKIILADLMREGLEILNKEQQKEVDKVYDSTEPEITLTDRDNTDISFTRENTSTGEADIQILKNKLKDLQEKSSLDEPSS